MSFKTKQLRSEEESVMTMGLKDVEADERSRLVQGIDALRNRDGELWTNWINSERRMAREKARAAAAQVRPGNRSPPGSRS
jgi:hypothetical protein